MDLIIYFLIQLLIYLVTCNLLVETDAYVLYRLSDTSGNINAPFSEQEWDDVVSGEALVPSLEVLANRTNEKIQQVCC